MKYLKYFESILTGLPASTVKNISAGDYIRVNINYAKPKIGKIIKINSKGWVYVDFIDNSYDIYPRSGSSNYNIEKLTELEINTIKYNL